MNSKDLFILAFLAFSQFALVSCRKAKTNDGLNGFTLDLIHRDSPLSPYYNPSITPSQRLRDAYHRSFSRASFFTKASIHSTTPFNRAIQSDIIPIPTEYLMKISIGTPPRETFAIVDTGSELTWIQCKPCTHNLIGAKREGMLYVCKECELVSDTTCVTKNVCEYEVTYGDNSYTIGDVSSETFTFNTTSSKIVSIPHVIFGCGHNNGGTFSNRTAGIVGLGDSKISIINQLDKQIKGKFSYCLVPNDDLSPSSHPPNTTSKINFGPKAFVSGPNVLKTPIIRKTSKLFYFLHLESVSVGSKKLEYFNSSQLNEELGNIIIDSGTTLTMVPGKFYNELESTLVEMIKGKRKENGPLLLCYETKSVVDKIPKIVFHFTDADIELLPMNTFAIVDDLSCLSIVEGGNIGVYGNLAQMNFLIGYDLVNHKLSFLPTDCTKQ